MQAIHDILTYGVPMNNAKVEFKALFDHMTFSGAVPRTFIGALVVSGVAKPFVWLGQLIGQNEQLFGKLANLSIPTRNSCFQSERSWEC